MSEKKAEYNRKYREKLKMKKMENVTPKIDIEKIDEVEIDEVKPVKKVKEVKPVNEVKKVKPVEEVKVEQDDEYEKMIIAEYAKLKKPKSDKFFFLKKEKWEEIAGKTIENMIPLTLPLMLGILSRCFVKPKPNVAGGCMPPFTPNSRPSQTNTGQNLQDVIDSQQRLYTL